MTRKGWECPKCGRCYAPDVKECRHCAKPCQPPIPESITIKITDPAGTPMPYRWYQPIWLAPIGLPLDSPYGARFIC